ncbi:LysR family transcriptional regulator [Vreelandella sp. EE27]
MNNKALLYFLTVVETGSLGNAAAKLHVASSAISRQIKLLEHEIDAKLFERSPKGMCLSSSGVKLLDYTRKLFLEEKRVIDEIKGENDRTVGSINIASPEGLSRCFLPTVITKYHNHYPNVKFSITVVSPSAATELVEEGKADIALTFSSSYSSGIKINFSQESPILALMRAEHPLSRKKELHAKDLELYPLAIMPEGTTQRQLFEICCNSVGIHIEPTLVSNYSGILQQFAAISNAITLTSSASSHMSNQVNQSVVVRPFIHKELNLRNVEVQTLEGRKMPKNVSFLLDLLIAEIDKLSK